MKTYTLYLLILVTLLHKTNTKIHHHKRHKVANTLNARNDILRTRSNDKLTLTDKTNKDQPPVVDDKGSSNDEDASSDNSDYKVVGAAFVNPSVGNKVVEPIGYDATGMNYHQTQDEREMEKRPVSNSESFNDENEFIKDTSPSSPFSSDTDAGSDGDPMTTIEKGIKEHDNDKADEGKTVENEEYDLQERATQHDRISAEDKKIIENDDGELREKASQHDEISASDDSTIADDDTQQQLVKSFQHNHISGSDDAKIAENENSIAYDDLKNHLQEKASRHDNINTKSDEIAEEAVSESFDEKPGIKTILIFSDL